MYLLQIVTAERQVFDNACGTVTTQGPATTQATQGPTTTDGSGDDDACFTALANVPANCMLTSENDVDTLCSRECRGFHVDVAANCANAVSFVNLLSKITGFIIYPVIL